MIFRKEPFFYGHDNYDQLVKIAKVCSSCACASQRGFEVLAFECAHALRTLCSMWHSCLCSSYLFPLTQGRSFMALL
jgi:hypothetical protein